MANDQSKSDANKVFNLLGISLRTGELRNVKTDDLGHLIVIDGLGATVVGLKNRLNTQINPATEDTLSEIGADIDTIETNIDVPLSSLRGPATGTLDSIRALLAGIQLVKVVDAGGVNRATVDAAGDQQVDVNNFPPDQVVHFTSRQPVLATGLVRVTNLPATQLVSGAVKIRDGSRALQTASVDATGDLQVDVNSLPSIPAGANDIGTVHAIQSGLWTVQQGRPPWKVLARQLGRWRVLQLGLWNVIPDRASQKVGRAHKELSILAALRTVSIYRVTLRKTLYVNSFHGSIQGPVRANLPTRVRIRDGLLGKAKVSWGTPGVTSGATGGLATPNIPIECNFDEEPMQFTRLVHFEVILGSPIVNLSFVGYEE